MSTPGASCFYPRSRELRRHLRGSPVPIDVIVAHTDQIKRYKDQPALIYYTTLIQGKLCYEPPQSSS